MTRSTVVFWVVLGCRGFLMTAVSMAAEADAGAPVVADGGASSPATDGGAGKTVTGAGAGAPEADEPETKRPALKVEKMPFSQESIRTVMAYHQEEIQGCYEKTLADKDKVIEGKLTTSFVITKEGGVRDVKVLKKGTSLREPKLHECVEEVIGKMKFPKPVDRRDHPIEYPFNLKTIR